MAFITLILETDESTDSKFSAAELTNRLDQSTRGKQQALRAIRNHLNGVAGGQHRGILRCVVGTVAASQTVTCDQSAATAGNTKLVIDTVTMTVLAAATASTTITLGASDTAFATNTASAINASTVLAKIVSASSSGAVVTITSRYPGPVGNAIGLAESAAGYTLGAATLTGGSSASIDAFDFGHT